MWNPKKRVPHAQPWEEQLHRPRGAYLPIQTALDRRDSLSYVVFLLFPFSNREHGQQYRDGYLDQSGHDEDLFLRFLYGSRQILCRKYT